MCLDYLLGLVSESESLFNYSIGDTSYFTANDGAQDYVPTFSDEVVANASQEVLDMCGGNLECVYDSSVTGSLVVGQATMDTSMTNDQTLQILGEYYDNE